MKLKKLLLILLIICCIVIEIQSQNTKKNGNQNEEHNNNNNNIENNDDNNNNKDNIVDKLLDQNTLDTLLKLVENGLVKDKENDITNNDINNNNNKNNNDNINKNKNKNKNKIKDDIETYIDGEEDEETKNNNNNNNKLKNENENSNNNNNFNQFMTFQQIELDPNGNIIINMVPNQPQKQPTINDDNSNNLQQQQQQEDQQQQQILRQKQFQLEQQILKQQILKQFVTTFNQDDFLFGNDIETTFDKKTKLPIADSELAGRDLVIMAQKHRGYLLYDQKSAVKTHRYSNSIMIYNFDQSPNRDIFEFVGETPITTLNPTKAYQLLIDAANQGNHRAMNLLGSMNEIGEINNGKINFTLAEEWYLKSAEYGNSDAQRSLGFLYATGKLGYIDEAKAILYYSFAARSGNIVAQLIMAYRYLHGYGVEKSCKKSSILYGRVNEKVISDYERRGFGYNIHSQRLSEEYEKKSTGYASEENDILEFFRYSAEMGDVASLITMARLSLEGSLMNQDFRLAIDYFKQAIDEDELDQTTAEGYAGLGFMYEKGYGVEQDNKTAVEYYTKAVSNGDRESRWRLAQHFLFGSGGVKQDTQKALELFESISIEMIVQDEEGNQVKMAPVNEALCWLGKIYSYGLGGVAINRVKASHYLSRAVAGGDVEAHYHFATIHLENDESTCPVVVTHLKMVAEKGPWSMILSNAQDLYDEDDTSRALLLSEKAAEMGIEAAQFNAAWMYDKRYGLSEYYNSNEEIEETTNGIDNNDNNDKNSIYINNLFNDEFFIQQALRLFYYSAEQQNALSHIKIGDYFYYGVGVEKNLESSAESYQIAANLYHPQGLFNLGYLYQWGQGVPQDLYLAKRYYDMSLTIKPEHNKQGYDGYYGYIPVYLSLTGLLFHFVYLYFLSFFDSSVQISNSFNNNNNNMIHPIVESPPTTSTTASSSSSSNNDGTSSFSSIGSTFNEIRYALDNEVVQTLETYLMVIFAIVIGYLVVRRQGILLRQNNNRRPLNQQQPQQ
ncbi:hypothetical protein ACTFIW_010012 [Dictyostelium discoideum]